MKHTITSLLSKFLISTSKCIDMFIYSISQSYSIALKYMVANVSCSMSKVSSFRNYNDNDVDMWAHCCYYGHLHMHICYQIAVQSSS